MMTRSSWMLVVMAVAMVAMMGAPIVVAAVRARRRRANRGGMPAGGPEQGQR